MLVYEVNFWAEFCNLNYTTSAEILFLFESFFVSSQLSLEKMLFKFNYFFILSGYLKSALYALESCFLPVA